MLSNSPPGCSSADGIDHEWEKLHEDIDKLADEHALDASDVMEALKVGIKTLWGVG